MRLLPGLPTPSGPLVLPMSDRSATALVELLLAPDPVRLIAVLECDPPLALWAAGVAATGGQCNCTSLGQLAQWLVDRALDVLQWPEHAPVEAPAACLEPGPLIAQVAKDLQRAELAALLAPKDSPMAAEEAYYFGLLADAHNWARLCLHRAQQSTAPGYRTEGPESPVVGWLDDAMAARPVAAAVVRSAIEVLGGAPLPGESTIDLAACEQKAHRAAQHWAERLAGPGDHLHLLSARLARLAKLERDFQAAVEAEKLASLAEFAAGAGHEINNPLTVITGRAQMLLRTEMHPERRRDLALISAQALRVYEMIADMRLFARPPKPQLELVQLGAIVQRALESIQEQAQRQQTQIVCRLPEVPLTLQADPTQLVVAVRAILQNSLEAIGQGGQVEISAAIVDGSGAYQALPAGGLQSTLESPATPGSPKTVAACGSCSGRLIELTIADNGPGITPEERRHIFDPFFSARQAGRGLGMGLSKCWRIVTNHGGSVEVESQPGQGATFRIRLPVEA